MKAQDAATSCFMHAVNGNAYQAKMTAHTFLEDNFLSLPQAEAILFYRIADSNPRDTMMVCSKLSTLYRIQKDI